MYYDKYTIKLLYNKILLMLCYNNNKQYNNKLLYDNKNHMFYYKDQNNYIKLFSNENSKSIFTLEYNKNTYLYDTRCLYSLNAFITKKIIKKSQYKIELNYTFNIIKYKKIEYINNIIYEYNYINNSSIIHKIYNNYIFINTNNKLRQKIIKNIKYYYYYFYYNIYIKKGNYNINIIETLNNSCFICYIFDISLIYF